MELKYGQTVTISGKFIKVHHDKDGKYFVDLRRWEAIRAEGKGIFLGYRTLANGWRSQDDGYYTFEHEVSFKVALVSPGPRRNPVYVPVDCIDPVGET